MHAHTHLHKIYIYESSQTSLSYLLDGLLGSPCPKMFAYLAIVTKHSCWWNARIDIQFNIYSVRFIDLVGSNAEEPKISLLLR